VKGHHPNAFVAYLFLRVNTETLGPSSGGNLFGKFSRKKTKKQQTKKLLLSKRLCSLREKAKFLFFTEERKTFARNAITTFHLTYFFFTILFVAKNKQIKNL